MKKLITILTFLLLFLQYKLWLGAGNLFDISQLNAHIGDLHAQNIQLKATNSAIMGKIREIQDEVQAIEGSARYDLGMVKENEIFYRTVERD